MEFGNVSGRVIKKVGREIANLRRSLLLKRVRGIIHVGANTGQERHYYARLGLDVIWFEPIPWIFDQLSANLLDYPKQTAHQYLLAEKDTERCILHIASNNGESSSLLDLHLHKEIWPNVKYEQDLELPAFALDSVIVKENIDLSKYRGLVVDTQGTELSVLRGAQKTLRFMKMVAIEVAEFDAYRDCAKPEEMARFLAPLGFREWRRTAFAKHVDAGQYFDIIFVR